MIWLAIDRDTAADRRGAPPYWVLCKMTIPWQVAPLDRYGSSGFGSAIPGGVRSLAGAWRNALRGIAGRPRAGGGDCEAV